MTLVLKFFISFLTSLTDGKMTDDGKFAKKIKKCIKKAISIQRKRRFLFVLLKEAIFSSNVDICALFNEVQG
jgi:hypothetical protein